MAPLPNGSATHGGKWLLVQHGGLITGEMPERHRQARILMDAVPVLRRGGGGSDDARRPVPAHG